MPSLSVAVRGLALAALSVGTVIATAQAQNVTAFNPYNGVGLPVGVSAQAGMTAAPPTRANRAIEAAPPAQGMAFNPWRSGNAGPAVVAAGVPNVVAAYAPGLPPPAFVPGYAGPAGDSFGSSLPPPPPGPIQSRIIAVPERGDRPGARRTAARPPTPPVTVAATEPTRALAPEPTRVPVKRAEAAPAPAPAAAPPAPPPPAAAAPPPPPPPAARPSPPIEVSRLPPATAPAPPPPATPAPAPRAVVTVSPPTPEPPSPPLPIAAPAMSVSFQPQSAEINDTARAALDAMAKSFTQRGVKQLELRAYAAGGDPGDARKVALARALSVRSYLIDQGVKARIEVGAFAAATRGTGSERVDVVTP